ncbi:MAG: hypothetical protein JRZ94_06505 [Nitrososphaerota archaeon]|nr:hypothetical protein [Nitrososphaerota archaeon]
MIDNIFDTENETDVYGTSGRALYDANEQANADRFNDIKTRIISGHQGMIPLSAIDNFYADPTRVSRPRLVRIGFSVYF